MLHHKHKQHRHRRSQKFFHWSASRHFACPFQTADDTMQMDVHITLYVSTPQRKWPTLLQQSQKCPSWAARILLTSYNSTWLTAISSHCFAALPATDVFNSHMRLNSDCRNLKWTFVFMLLLAMNDNFRNIRTQVSQPATAGNVTDTSELQAQNCMTPQHWTWLLRSVSVISENKTVVARIKSIKLLISAFYNFWFLVPISRWWKIPILSPLQTPMNTGKCQTLKQRASYTYTFTYHQLGIRQWEEIKTF